MDLSGQTFNYWRVLKPSDGKKYYYDCECLKCGKIYSVYQSTLKNSKGKMCRVCAAKEQAEAQRAVHQEIIGRQFGRLTVTGWTKAKNNRTMYTCNCTCGNQTTVGYTDLITGKKSSCGCLRKDESSKRIEQTYEPMYKKQNKARIDGTIAYGLDAKVSKNSKTGIKGVSKNKKGKYRAYINLARKQHHLGVFDTLEEAKEARNKAEKEFYDPILKKYKDK
nr:AP2 domain-containing protein [Tetragenococcus muriaticus]